MIKTSTIHALASFADIHREAPELAAMAAGQDFFVTTAWFENLLAHGFDRQARLHLLLATDSAGAHCLLPLVAGRGLTSLSNYYSSLYGPVQTAFASSAEFLRLICSHIRNDAARWAFINLQPLAADDPFVEQAAATFAEAGYWVDRYACFGNWYLDVAERSFAQYYSALPSALRHNVERGRTRLKRVGDWSVRILASGEDDLENALRDYDAIYASSWKKPEPFPGFIPHLCRMAAAKGWLRLGILELGGQAIAAQIWIVKDGVASIYKLAYDGRFGRLSPGSILSADMMKHSIDQDHVRVVDYLTGDDAYKKDWMSHRRERIGLIAFNPATLRGLTAGSWHFMKKWLKRQIQR